MHPGGDTHKTLSSLLSVDRIAQDAQIIHERIAQVLVAPGDATIPSGDGSGEWQERRSEPRLTHLLDALQEYAERFRSGIQRKNG